MQFEDLNINLPTSLPEGWQNRPDAVEQLATAVGRALAAQSDQAMLPFVRVAADLEAAGNDDWAHLLVQALLVQLTRRGTDLTDDASSLLMDENLYQLMLDEVLLKPNAGDPILRAATLTLAGRVAMAERSYELAISAFRGAEIAWTALQVSEELSSVLMGLAAAYHYTGDFGSAEQVTGEALAALANTDDSRGRAMLSLNSVQNSLAVGDIEGARRKLRDLADPVRRLRDGHISTSFLLNEAAILIQLKSWADARQAYLKAARRARRRSDLGQLMIASKNLAKLTSEHISPSQGLHWWRVARDSARDAHDWREEQDSERALGASLAELTRFPEAVAAFERAIGINERFGDALGVARTRADLGAVILSWALEDSRGARSSKLVHAIKTIDNARLELELLGDFDWAEATVRNLHLAWSLESPTAPGVATLSRAADQFAAIEPDYSGELLRNAALLKIGSAEDPGRGDAVQWLITAAARLTAPGDQTAWALASDAGMVSGRFDLHAEALQLFDAALGLLDRIEQATAWGNIQNDAALVAAAAGDLPEAERRLREVEDMARSMQNRALLALAVLNLGELAARQDMNGRARTRFKEAASLFEALEDVASAAGAWASVSNSWVDDGSMEEALPAANRAMAFAILSDSGDALARAHSSHASISYANGDYSTAYKSWKTSASLVEERDAGEYNAFALDSLARLSNWPRFKRELDRLSTDAQDRESELVFIQQLHLSGLTWLRQDRPRAAGVVLGYIVVLALSAISRTRDPSLSQRDSGLVEQLAAALGASHAFFNLLELPVETLKPLRREFERTVHRIAGGSAPDIIEFVNKVSDDMASHPNRE